jgi:hypothetical protein
MKFWRNTRLDDVFDVPLGELIDGFLASHLADVPLPLDLRLRLFLTDPDGPVNGVWDSDDDYQQLYGALAAVADRRSIAASWCSHDVPGGILL